MTTPVSVWHQTCRSWSHLLVTFSKNRLLRQGLKIAVGLALVAYLLSRIELSEVRAALSRTDPFLVVLAFLLFGVSRLFDGARLHLLIRRFGFKVREAVEILMVSMFFNNLSTSVVGDGYEVLALRKKIDGWKTPVALVIVERTAGLVSIGLVDKDKVGITGGSYGGYASAWGATYYSHRYAASVMFVGISDMFLCFALGDIPEELRLVHYLKYPWEDAELMRQRSPINHFQKCRTPLLILHGKSDTRVHPAHSLALYRAIKTYGKTPVRLVRYPGEPHGNRRTGSRLDFSLRLMRWMNHYLKGPGGDPPPYMLDLSGIKPDEQEEDNDMPK